MQTRERDQAWRLTDDSDGGVVAGGRLYGSKAAVALGKAGEIWYQTGRQQRPMGSNAGDSNDSDSGWVSSGGSTRPGQQ